MINLQWRVGLTKEQRQLAEALKYAADDSLSRRQSITHQRIGCLLSRRLSSAGEGGQPGVQSRVGLALQSKTYSEYQREHANKRRDHDEQVRIQKMPRWE